MQAEKSLTFLFCVACLCPVRADGTGKNKSLCYIGAYNSTNNSSLLLSTSAESGLLASVTLLGCVLHILTSQTSEIVLGSFRSSGEAPTWKGLCHGDSYSILVKQRAQDLHFAMFMQSLVSLETTARACIAKLEHWCLLSK